MQHGPTRFVSIHVESEWYVYDLRTDEIVEGPFANNDQAMNACAAHYQEA